MQQEAAVAQVRPAPEICLEGLTKTTKNLKLTGVMSRNWYLQNTDQKLCRMIRLAQLVRLLRYELCNTAIVLVSETVKYLLFEQKEGRNKRGI